jgi:hypothetical protein
MTRSLRNPGFSCNKNLCDARALNREDDVDWTLVNLVKTQRRFSIFSLVKIARDDSLIDERNRQTSSAPMALRQGSLDLLESDIARRLLASRIPARFAYIARDGTPRVLATWFHWTSEVLAMPTFLAAPHVRHAAGHLHALRANPAVAVTIDTETMPPEILTMRGRVTISEVEGIPPEYASAARRYLGDEAARKYLDEIDQPGTRMARIHLHPTWVGVLDFQTRLPSALGGIS